MNYYNIAIATGLTVEQAKLFSTAMTYANAGNINHLNVHKCAGCLTYSAVNTGTTTVYD